MPAAGCWLSCTSPNQQKQGQQTRHDTEKIRKKRRAQQQTMRNCQAYLLSLAQCCCCLLACALQAVLHLFNKRCFELQALCQVSQVGLEALHCCILVTSGHNVSLQDNLQQQQQQQQM
jgi:hypothetical protein